MYDAKSKKGALYNGILNRRRKNNQTAEISICETSSIELNDQDKEDVKNFLKTCVLPRDKKALKAKLVEFKVYRNELITQSFDEYKEIWNFYFVCPDLVSSVSQQIKFRSVQLTSKHTVV